MCVCSRLGFMCFGDHIAAMNDFAKFCHQQQIFVWELGAPCPVEVWASMHAQTPVIFDDGVFFIGGDVYEAPQDLVRIAHVLDAYTAQVPLKAASTVCIDLCTLLMR